MLPPRQQGMGQHFHHQEGFPPGGPYKQQPMVGGQFQGHPPSGGPVRPMMGPGGGFMPPGPGPAQRVLSFVMARTLCLAYKRSANLAQYTHRTRRRTPKATLQVFMIDHLRVLP